jgi:aspartate/methionine/tyrosine aminotransferase
VKRAAVDAILTDNNQYPVTFGEPALRAAIARKALAYNGIRCNPDTDITVTCGSTEAMLATLKAVINPGEEVVVFEPFYENYGPDAILSGARPRYVTLYPPDWELCPDELAAAFNERTKAIIINTPNNPTGKVFSRDELRLIAELCLKWDCLAITDEIYEHILYDGSEHISIATLDGMADRTVTLNSISKTYSVTGWRVGWSIAHERITQRIRKVHDFMTVGAPTPFQVAAVFALGLGADYYQALSERYERSRTFLFDLLSRTGFKPFLPHGAYYIMAETGALAERLGAQDDFAFCRRLMDVARVATVPGTSFYATEGKGRNQIRFCFCKSEETLGHVAEGLQLLGHLR